jgi:hypothetical protein
VIILSPSFERRRSIATTTPRRKLEFVRIAKRKKPVDTSPLIIALLSSRLLTVDPQTLEFTLAVDLCPRNPTSRDLISTVDDDREETCFLGLGFCLQFPKPTAKFVSQNSL